MLWNTKSAYFVIAFSPYTISEGRGRISFEGGYLLEVYYYIAGGLLIAGLGLRIAAYFMRKKIKKMREEEQR